MPGPLSNPRQEAFCHAIVKGETADKAYQLAGYKANRGNASVLKSQQIIKDRIAEIQGNIAIRLEEKVAVDKAWVLERSRKLHIETADAQEYNASARFLEMCGRHVDVQAFKDTSDVNVNITVDSAIARLAQLDAPVIEGDYEVIEGDGT